MLKLNNGQLLIGSKDLLALVYLDKYKVESFKKQLVLKCIHQLKDGRLCTCPEENVIEIWSLGFKEKEVQLID